MRKSLFLMFILSLCAADFGAFAAPARGNARGTAAAPSAGAATQGAAPVAARAGARQKVVSTPTATSTAAVANGNVAARAGKKQTVKSTPTTTSAGTSTTAAAKPMAARAGATQKVIQTGSKVATATTNTAVPQECQDAFYGCMDSFCMLDNASGGRCQCNDRITELDTVLEDILKLDQQTYIMATEGVERIQMGEAADQIMARAKAAADKVTVEEKKTQQAETKKNKIKQLDLSAWNNNSLFSDDDEEDAFGTADTSSDLVDTFADKKGDELYKASAKMCMASVVTDQCKQYGSMLQLVYAQRIKSDCIAYENSLKQQRNASQQKLQTAQKALRDAAMDEFNDQNKYADVGSCVVALKQCVQSTGECGSDFSGCVADTATLNALYKNGNSTVATVKLTDSVTISKATYEILQSGALKCESVVKQCVNANGGKDLFTGNVFKQFIKDIAPAVYSTEYSMASNARMNCITTIVNCVKTSCKSAGMDEGTDNYEACLSNPDSIKNYCSLEIPKCGDTMSQNDVLKYVAAKLAADKVDACTKQVTECLTADTACGEDYSGCIGLDTETIADLCPAQKLTACMDKHNKDSVRDFVNQIAMGISLKIDNSMLATCQKAADDAMSSVCGSTEDCAKFALDKNLGATSLKYQVCQVIIGTGENGNPLYTVNEGACKDSAEQITKQEMGLDTLTASTVRGVGSIQSGSSSWGFGVAIPFIAFGGGRSDSQTNINYVRYSKYTLKPGETTMYSPTLKGTIDWGNQIKTENIKDASGLDRVQFACTNADKCDENLQNIVASLNNSIDRIIKSVESDTKVEFCMTGRKVQTTGGGSLSSKNNGKGEARFPNLTSSIRQTIANNVYNTAINNYNEKLAELEQKRDEDYLTISSKYEEVAAENDEKQLQQRLATNCQSLTRDNSTWNYKETISASYSESSKICTKVTRTQKCKSTTHASNPGRRSCTEWANPEEKTEQLHM